MRPRRGFVLLVAAGLALTACSADDAPPQADEASPPPADVTTVQEGVLTACVAPTPGRLEAGGADGWTGPDVEVLQDVAADLRLDLELTEVAFDELVSGVALNSMRCDVGAGGVVDHEDLDAVVRTSQPYAPVVRLVVGEGPEVEPEEVTGRIGVEEGGPASDATEALTAAEVVPFPSATDLDRAVRAGQVEGALVTLAGRERLPALAVRTRVATDDQYVLLLPLGAEDDLVEAVDEALAGPEDG